MSVHTITKNGVTFEISQAVDRYGTMNVTARMGGQSQWGTIPGTSQRTYPRIEFLFCPKAQWLHKLADRRSWAVDEYDDGEEIKRSTDHCEFSLTPQDVEFLNSWRLNQEQAAETTTATPVRPPFRQEFGIGRIGDADPAMEALAELGAVEINRRNSPKRPVKLCDCGHYTAWPMSTSSGSSCPDCYDRMSL